MTAQSKIADQKSKMVEIINRQRKRRVNAGRWREFTARAVSAIGIDGSDATVVFASDAALKKLNRQFRGKNYATDVLSFPTHAEKFEKKNERSLGEIVISVDRAAIQAKENGLTLTNEVQQLILHGLLHLAGYDHETDSGEMNRLELRLRKNLGL